MAQIQEKGLVVSVRANIAIFVCPVHSLLSQLAFVPKLRIMQYYGGILLSK